MHGPATVLVHDRAQVLGVCAVQGPEEGDEVPGHGAITPEAVVEALAKSGGSKIDAEKPIGITGRRCARPSGGCRGRAELTSRRRGRRVCH